MAASRRLATEDAQPIEPAVADTIREIEADDVVVVNEDGRTWLVTDAIEASLADDSTDRVSKWAVRLQSKRSQEPGAATIALVLVEYPDHEEGVVHVLDPAKRLERDATYRVDRVEVLDPEPSWVVVQRAGHSSVFHLPAPEAAATGEALPACGGQPGENDPSEYRVVARRAVPGLQVCRDCARRQRPRELDTVTCPACGRNIVSGLLQGPRPSGVDGLELECPESDCSYHGTVDLPSQSASTTAGLGGGA